MRAVLSLKGLTVAALVAVIIAAGSVAYSAIGGGGVVTSCYNANTGSWVPIDTAVTPSCPAGTKTIVFYTKDKVDTLVEKRLTKAQANKLYAPLDHCQQWPHFQVDYNGCDLRGRNLSHSDMAGGNLSGTNLAFTFLDSANLGGTDLSGADLTGASVENASLESGTDLTNANLTLASFRNSNLQGATLTGATLTNTVWDNTVCPDGTNSNNDGGTCVGHL
jgi:uncharacterized protein YjbI with pentapeptide repeats